MSHIFDALQRSEAERSGADTPTFSLATELLQVAEREASADREIAPQEVLADTLASAPAVTDVFQPPVFQEGAENAISQDLPASRGRVDQFSQFQSLRLLVPPQSKLVCLTDKESLAGEKFRF